MTVGELIEELKKLPQGKRVFASTGDEFGNEILPGGVKETRALVEWYENGVTHVDQEDVVYIGNGAGVVAEETP